MSFVVAIISCEQELSKEIALKYVKVALDFIKSFSKMRIIACENGYDVSIVLKAEYSEYLQIDTSCPDKILYPIFDFDTGLEELVEKHVLRNVEHELLTESESRKHDFVRDDWTILINEQDGSAKFVDVLDKEGIFYE